MYFLNKIGLSFRVFARIIDYSLCYLLINAIAFGLPYFYPPLFYALAALAVPFLWVPIETFCLGRFGTTPGKAVFGLSVHTAEGFLLSYKQAFKRALLFSKGPGILHSREVSWKRKLSGIVTSALFVIAAVYGNALALWATGIDTKSGLYGWVQYESDSRGFKVAFPKDPESAAKELPIPNSDKVLNYEEVTSQESRKVSYSVSHLEIPKKWRIASNTTLLKGVLDALVKHSDGAVLVDKEFKKHGNFRVLDYRMFQGRDEMQGRLIIVDGILYKLTVTHPQSKGDFQQITAFLDSFEVVK